MTALRLAAWSIYVPTEFSSTMIAEACVSGSSMKSLPKSDRGIDAYNLGTGKGYSVLEIVNTFMKVNNVDVPYKIVERRPGDIAACYASTEKANKLLGWKAELEIDEMCKDAYNYVINNK